MATENKQENRTKNIIRDLIFSNKSNISLSLEWRESQLCISKICISVLKDTKSYCHPPPFHVYNNGIVLLLS